MKQPNIVLCTCDQMRADALGCYGNGIVHTPNLDRLAAGGTRFDLCFSNNPVCTPARSCMLTGKYSRTCTGMLGNVHLNPPNPKRERMLDPTLPEVLRDAGYETALIGKWHIDPQPQLIGFDSANYPLVAHKHYGQVYFDEACNARKVDEFGSDYEAARLQDFLSRDRDQPFFLFYNISPPHQPIGPGHMPERYLSMYDPAEIPIPPNAMADGAPVYSKEWFRIYRSADYFWYNLRGEPIRPEDEAPDAFDLRGLTALYYGAVTCVDDYVGNLLAQLDAQGLRDDTLIVFVSDHGDNLGSHGRFNKGTLNEEAIRVPLIVNWPNGVHAADDRKHLASLVDLMPTILDLANIGTPDQVQGRSLAAACRNAALPEAGRVYIETPRNDVGIRTATHKLTAPRNPETGELDGDAAQLFDLTSDPYEQQDLSGAAEHADLLAALLNQLQHWNAATPFPDIPPPVGDDPLFADQITCSCTHL